MEETTCTCCHKTKERSQEEYKSLQNRLNRIEGQVRGIRNMLEKDAYCPDILVQVAAACAALNSFSKELLAKDVYKRQGARAANLPEEKIERYIELCKKIDELGDMAELAECLSM